MKNPALSYNLIWVKDNSLLLLQHKKQLLIVEVKCCTLITSKVKYPIDLLLSSVNEYFTYNKFKL